MLAGGGIVKTFRLADYAADGVLQDLDDARFFARKVGPEDRLDFEGVTAVSSDFLDILLASQKPGSLKGRILNKTGAVHAALTAWSDRQQPGRSPTPSAERGGRPPVTARSKTAPPVEFNRPEPEGERYTP